MPAKNVVQLAADQKLVQVRYQALSGVTCINIENLRNKYQNRL
jgi:hypothetical protein